MSEMPDRRFPRWRDKSNFKHRRFGITRELDYFPGPRANERAETILERYQLAIIQRSRQLGFTLTELRHLFFGFRDISRASERWRTLSQRKLVELDDLTDGIKAVRGVLKRLMTQCRCETLDQ